MLQFDDKASDLFQRFEFHGEAERVAVAIQLPGTVTLEGRTYVSASERTWLHKYELYSHFEECWLNAVFKHMYSFYVCFLLFEIQIQWHKS